MRSSRELPLAPEAGEVNAATPPRRWQPTRMRPECGHSNPGGRKWTSRHGGTACRPDWRVLPSQASFQQRYSGVLPPLFAGNECLVSVAATGDHGSRAQKQRGEKLLAPALLRNSIILAVEILIGEFFVEIVGVGGGHRAAGRSSSRRRRREFHPRGIASRNRRAGSSRAPPGADRKRRGYKAAVAVLLRRISAIERGWRGQGWSASLRLLLGIVTRSAWFRSGARNVAFVLARRHQRRPLLRRARNYPRGSRSSRRRGLGRSFAGRPGHVRTARRRLRHKACAADWNRRGTAAVRRPAPGLHSRAAPDPDSRIAGAPAERDPGSSLAEAAGRDPDNSLAEAAERDPDNSLGERRRRGLAAAKQGQAAPGAAESRACCCE